MEKKITAAVFGDSIMKCTVFEEGRYRSCFDRVSEVLGKFPVTIDNRSRFGFTVKRGLELIKRAVGDGVPMDYGVVEYGGNDCNFDWKEVVKAPRGEHRPATPLPEFLELLDRCAETLRGAGVQPVLMSLPPIDCEAYYRYILSKGIPEEPLLEFLGSPLALYRQQELYSGAVRQYAREKGLPLVDVRKDFLSQLGSAFQGLMCGDGLHPTEKGYRLMMDCFGRRLETIARAGA